MCEISDVTISTICMNVICSIEIFAWYLISLGLRPAYDNRYSISSTLILPFYFLNGKTNQVELSGSTFFSLSNVLFLLNYYKYHEVVSSIQLSGSGIYLRAE